VQDCVVNVYHVQDPVTTLNSIILNLLIDIHRSCILASLSGGRAFGSASIPEGDEVCLRVGEKCMKVCVYRSSRPKFTLAFKCNLEF